MGLLKLSGIWKAFGRTTALADAGFELAAGEVHALVGANGAGKSTLSRVVSGHVLPDRGEILLDGAPVRIGSSRDAIRRGIAMVTQETTLAPDLSVLENILLPQLGMPGRISWPALRRQARDLVEELGQEAALSLDSPVRELTVAQRQLVEILKSLALDSRIIIFDEPTASLSPHESERLFEIMRSLVERGRGLIFVSHRLEEIFTISDRVTILREGRVVGESLPTQTLSPSDLVRRMVGRELSDVYARSGAAAPGTARAEVVLSVRHLTAPPRVRDVSFDVHAGEILGLAGLVGAGRSETVETIFGLRRAAGGTIELAGRRFAPKTSLDAIRAGIGFIPEDRRAQGIVPDFSVRENLLLAHLGRRAGPTLGYGAQRAAIERLLELLGLPSERLLDANMLNFSGGMQQKVILARWLLLQPRLMLLDEPTRGVDIGTRSSIYALLRKISAEGVAMVVVSSDFEEILGIADRIVVMSDGCDVTDIPNKLVDVEKLTMFAAPRSSAERTHTVLEALVGEYGGIASWVAIDGERVFCFDRLGSDPDADPGFAAGAFPTIEETSIRRALRARSDDFVAEADGRRRTLFVPILGRRGHDLGLIGLTLAGDRPVPDGRRLSAQVHEWTAATRAGPSETLGAPA